MKQQMKFAAVTLFAALAACSPAATTPSTEARIAQLEKELQSYRDAEKTVAENIKRFGELDLVAFNNRDWDLIKQIHHETVKAHSADGFVSDGMVPAHEWDLKFLFETFPDFKIHEHLISFGSGEWTAGLSRSTGTFTEPMTLRDGVVIQPTGKPFEFFAITLARWENGRIMDEYIYWDNYHLFQQIGIID